jgi:type IV pilus assembly protein PilE
MKKRQGGVTLVELMVVLLVLAIIASIAVPSYRRYMVRANRTEATAALLQLRISQEKFFLQNSRYATLAEVDDAPPGGLGIATTTLHGYYTIDMLNVSNTTYTARATAAGGQADDETCPTLTITESGVRGAGGPVDVCWK